MNDDPQPSVVIGNVSDWPGIDPVQYEYLDHTADVQLHAWGSDIREAFEQTVMSMFGYMTDIDRVQVQFTYDIDVSGEDKQSLLFHLLDECLFAFSAEPFFIARTIRIIDIDLISMKINARMWGESFDIAKHPQGADVKAITYSNMQIVETTDSTRVDTYVIIDI